MTWEEQLFALFDDLEGQAEALYDAEREAEVADRSRAEYQQVTLASRLMASLDREIGLEVTGLGAVRGRLHRVSAEWCLLAARAQEWIVPLAAISVVRDASPRSVPEVAWSPLTRLGLGSALRRLAEAEERCLVHLDDGSRHEGRFTRVGADFAEAVGDHGGTLLVAFARLAAVQSRTS
ncbi:hypothetical protein [uncultured Nocardioides sp.]|uniref:Uncharacterized protein n=1 Tax=uncultured Nocardioides sp. TaxID=198441 RepID=A0A6J4MVU4_9ACTN|nr:hypothetical protein [uncultured Nocardioides sp.]CAA9370367.1 MAG: hypothetical protein AVDCRST_MAG06-2 [uncultured Nocardioides sp.]